jgi:hypothetical protein
MGDWMVSRVAAAIAESALSVSFAQRAYDGAKGFDAPDWLAASCAEVLARAYAARGDSKRRNEWYDVARGLVTAIVDDEDRELIASQLVSVPREASPATDARGTQRSPRKLAKGK